MNKYNFLIIHKLIYVIIFSIITYSLVAQDVTFQKQPSVTQKKQELLKEAEAAENSQNAVAAAEAYRKVIELSRQENDTTDLPMLLFLYGQALTFVGDYENAMNQLIESINLSHSVDKEIEARGLMQVGIIHFFMKEWDQALLFYQRAEVLINELGSKQGLSIVLNNISNIYQKKLDYDKAIEGYKRSLKIQDQVGDSATICNTLFNIGTCYESLENISEAKEYYEKAIDIAFSINDVEIASLASAHMGKLKLQNGETAQAVRLLDSAEKISQTNDYRQVLAEVYQVRSEAYEAIGNYRGSLEYYKRMKGLSDTLAQEQTKKQINEFQVKYETAEKEHLIQIQKAELQRKNIMQWIFLVGFLISLAVLVVVNRFRQLVRRRNCELREINAMKDKFFSIISHDLKNPAVAQRNALQMLVDNGDKLDSNSLSKYYGELLKSADMQVDLLYSLLDWARVQTGRMPYNPSAFDLAEVVRNELSLVNVMLKNKNIEVLSDFPDNALANGDRNMIATVMRNLLSNAIKFTNRGGKINVAIALINRYQLSVTVKDNGVGMDAYQINNLFRIDKQHSSSDGTDGERGSGLGLIVCKDLVERNGGKIQVESIPGKGTTFQFTLGRP